MYRAAHSIADIDVNVTIRMRERAKAHKGQTEQPYAELLEQDKEIFAERALFLRDRIERTRAEQIRRAKHDLISTSEFPNVSSAAGLRRFVCGLHPDQQGQTVRGGGGMVTHHHHILGSSMAL